MNKYSVKCSPIETRKSSWNKTLVEIFEDDKKIGEYERGYHSYGEATFFPFTRDNEWYALYSADYTTTRVMKLPSCEDIGGEEPNSCGFCPVEFYVPSIWKWSDPNMFESDYVWTDRCKPGEPGIEFSHHAEIGFVAGCIWGDDSSWKIQLLDLSDPYNITREEAFGYIHLPDELSLSEAVEVYVSGRSGKVFAVNISHRQQWRHQDGDWNVI